ncbi:hypothetical protein TDB9533_00010 [Thalassocella blandensis]|nr:hypothetical protein TDB9533_00010 [Thalassocella blandensis]
MTSTFKLLLLLFSVCILTSCSTVSLDPPAVSVVNIRPQHSGGLDFSVQIGLKISNPNSVALPIRGMSYALMLNNVEVLQGVSNDIPTIAAYGTENVNLTLNSSLFSAPKLLMDLIKKPQNAFDYELRGKIDMANFLPNFNFSEKGTLPVRE